MRIDEARVPGSRILCGLVDWNLNHKIFRCTYTSYINTKTIYSLTTGAARVTQKMRHKKL